jgi:hypothetical protein
MCLRACAYARAQENWRCDGGLQWGGALGGALWQIFSTAVSSPSNYNSGRKYGFEWVPLRKSLTHTADARCAPTHPVFGHAPPPPRPLVSGRHIQRTAPRCAPLQGAWRLITRGQGGRAGRAARRLPWGRSAAQGLRCKASLGVLCRLRRACQRGPCAGEALLLGVARTRARTYAHIHRSFITQRVRLFSTHYAPSFSLRALLAGPEERAREVAAD